VSRREPNRAAPAEVDLRIDELVLHGVAARDRHRAADAIERELAQLIAARGVPPSLAAGSVADAPAPAVVLPRGAGPDELGREVAVAIYQAIGSAGRPRRSRS
jgi:hypothetical protein